jgi:DNA-directed RNA polymerase subunit H
VVASPKKKNDTSGLIKKEELFAHFLVPKHEIVAEKEIDSLLKSLNIANKLLLPHISKDDVVVVSVGAKEGDVLKIDREEPTGKTTYFRVVVP